MAAGSGQRGSGRARSVSSFIFVALSQLCMSKRYDGSQRALDLKSLRVDPGEHCSPPQGCKGQEGAAAGDISPPISFPPLLPDLVSQNIDVVLNQRSCMLVVLRIIEDNIPEVRMGCFSLHWQHQTPLTPGFVLS